MPNQALQFKWELQIEKVFKHQTRKTKCQNQSLNSKLGNPIVTRHRTSKFKNNYQNQLKDGPSQQLFLSPATVFANFSGRNETQVYRFFFAAGAEVSAGLAASLIAAASACTTSGGSSCLTRICPSCPSTLRPTRYGWKYATTSMIPRRTARCAGPHYVSLESLPPYTPTLRHDSPPHTPPSHPKPAHVAPPHATPLPVRLAMSGVGVSISRT